MPSLKLCMPNPSCRKRVSFFATDCFEFCSIQDRIGFVFPFLVQKEDRVPGFLSDIFSRKCAIILMRDFL